MTPRKNYYGAEDDGMGALPDPEEDDDIDDEEDYDDDDSGEDDFGEEG